MACSVVQQHSAQEPYYTNDLMAGLVLHCNSNTSHTLLWVSPRSPACPTRVILCSNMYQSCCPSTQTFQFAVCLEDGHHKTCQMTYHDNTSAGIAFLNGLQARVVTTLCRTFTHGLDLQVSWSRDIQLPMPLYILYDCTTIASGWHAGKG